MPSSLDFSLVGRLAEPQDRLVHRRQLLGAGIAETTIDRLRDRGQLIDVFPGVYLVGVPGLSHREFLRACVLYAGPLSWPRGRSSLELRKVVPVNTGFATLLTTKDMDTPIRTSTKLVGGGFGVLNTKRVRSASEVCSEVVDGFQTTRLTQALAEFANSEGPVSLQRAWREATFLSLLDAEAVRRDLDERRRPGNAAVRERLLNAPPVTRPGIRLRSRSGELAFLELVRDLGLPEPLINVPIDLHGFRYVPDFRWVDIGLVAETDGGMHDLPWHRLADEVRTAHLRAAGLWVHRVSNDDLAADRDACGVRLLDIYAERKRLCAAAA